jgi:pyruvate/2-oxoglutarate dehydrogenase complex dihydrolipoamide acyltransferase (E2) component
MKLLHEIKIPQESVNDDQVVIIKLHFKSGDEVKLGETVLEYETSKATLTMDALETGFILYYFEEGDTVDVGRIVAEIYDEKNSKETTISKKKASEKINFQTDLSTSSEILKKTLSATIFSQKAKQYIKENGLDESEYFGQDFVNIDDVLFRQGPESKAELGKNLPVSEYPSEINFSKKNVHLEKISNQKKREIEYLSNVQRSGLNSSVSAVIEIEKVLSFVKSEMTLLNESFLPIIIYELARLLKKYPKLNSYFINDTIAFYNDINVGIAIDLGKGLMVLKIPNADRMNIVQIEESILELSKRYYADQTTLNDVSDITFTITDLTDSSVSSFLPLINKNNSAILAISSVDEKLKRLNLTITFDHRVTEGKYVANFINELKTRIESYSLSTNLKNGVSGDKAVCYKCRRKLKDNLYDTITFLKVIDSNGDEKILCSICYDNH